jgi:hypothetical protein
MLGILTLWIHFTSVGGSEFCSVVPFVFGFDGVYGAE